MLSYALCGIGELLEQLGMVALMDERRWYWGERWHRFAFNGAHRTGTTSGLSE